MTSQRLYGEAAWVPSGLLDSLLAENPVDELLKCKKSFYKYFTKGQLISECSLDLLNFPKKNNEKFDKFLPWNLSDQIIKIKANSYT